MFFLCEVVCGQGGLSGLCRGCRKFIRPLELIISDLMTRFFRCKWLCISIEGWWLNYKISSVGGNQPGIERVFVYVCKTDIYNHLRLWAARSSLWILSDKYCWRFIHWISNRRRKGNFWRGFQVCSLWGKEEVRQHSFSRLGGDWGAIGERFFELLGSNRSSDRWR